MILFTFLTLAAADLVPQAQRDQVAYEFVNLHWADARLVQSEVYSDASGEPSVQAYVYRLTETALDDSRDYDKADEEWGVDCYATVIVGARYSQNPIFEISNALPASITNKEKALARAAELWPDKNPRLAGYVYLSPLNEWFEFATDEGPRYLHSREFTEYDLSLLEPSRSQWGQVLSVSEHPGWQRLRTGGVRLAETNKVEDVPYALWSYGCSPTASSMIFDYWDRRGYPDLVDYYFDRWDNVEQENDYNLTNVHRELAVAMYTESLYVGGTGTGSITPGHISVANSTHGYSFVGTTISGSNTYNYGAIIDEIDDGRPVHWSVGNYEYGGEPIYHSICAVGYEITSSNDSLVILHNTWDKAEHRWAYETPGSYSDVYPLEPDGKKTEDLRLTTFNGACITYKGLKYPVCWSKSGSLSNIKVWLAKNDKKSNWTQLGTADATDDYLLVDMTDEFYGARINIEAYSGNALEAADGSSSPLAPLDLPVTPHFTPRAHLPAGEYSLSKTLIRGNTAYVSAGPGGLRIAEIEEDVIIPLDRLEIQNVADLTMDEDWLYVLGNDTLFVYDVSDPPSPAFLKSYALSGGYDQMAASQGFVYVAGINSRLEGLRQENQQLITAFNLPETLTTGLRVIDNKLYVCVFREGVRIYDLTNPASPELEETVETSFTPVAVARYNSTLFVAEKSKGIEVIDLNTSQSETYGDGAAYNVEVAADRLFVIGGQDGLSIYKITGATSLELLGNYSPPNGAVEGIDFKGFMYLGCGFDGLMAIETDLAGIQEPEPASGYPTLELASLARPGTTLGSIRLARAADMAVRLCDVAGRTLVSISDTYSAGVHSLPNLPQELPAGVYFVTVKTTGYNYTGKVVVLR